MGHVWHRGRDLVCLGSDGLPGAAGPGSYVSLGDSSLRRGSSEHGYCSTGDVGRRGWLAVAGDDRAPRIYVKPPVFLPGDLPGPSLGLPAKLILLKFVPLQIIAKGGKPGRGC